MQGSMVYTHQHMPSRLVPLPHEHRTMRLARGHQGWMKSRCHAVREPQLTAPLMQANRSDTPEAVIAALDFLPGVLTAMGVNTMLVPGAPCTPHCSCIRVAEPSTPVWQPSCMLAALYRSPHGLRRACAVQYI